MTTPQIEILCRIKGGMHPLAGITGRRVGAICRNLETLRLRGFLSWRGESTVYHLTSRGRAIIGG